MRTIAIIACALALGACSETMMTGRSTATRTPVQISPADTEAVKAAVAKEMRDPDSAKFDTIKAGATPEGAVVVCGFVNAKNGYGGYSGKEPFAGYLKNGEFTVVAISPSVTAKWAIRAQVQDLCGTIGDYYQNPLGL